jgi:hypothetical protein
MEMYDNKMKENQTRKAFLFWLFVILFAAPLLYSGEVIVIRVVDEMALARLEPDPGSQVLRQFPMGALLEAKSRIGDWYEISFTDDSGYTIVAYIQSGSVEVIREDVAPPPQAYEETVPLDTPLDTEETGGILNGFFLKFGVIDKGWSDWIGSLGYDFRLHKNISLGLEVMPSYITVNDDELELKTIHAFTLVNLRAGTSLYFIDPDMDFFKIYAGVGGGMALSYTDSTIEGSSSTLFKYNPALQILGGIELDTGKVSLIFEYQMLRELDKNMDPNAWIGYLIFGIRF